MDTNWIQIQIRRYTTDKILNLCLNAIWFHRNYLVSVVCGCYAHHNLAQLQGRLEQYRHINHGLPNNKCKGVSSQRLGGLHFVWAGRWGVSDTELGLVDTETSVCEERWQWAVSTKRRRNSVGICQDGELICGRNIASQFNVDCGPIRETSINR